MDHAWLRLTWAEVAKPILEFCLWEPLPAASRGIILHSCEVWALQETAGLCLAPHSPPYQGVVVVPLPGVGIFIF